VPGPLGRAVMAQQRGALDRRLLDLRSRSATATAIRDVLAEHDCARARGARGRNSRNNRDTH
jgi:hypothetical protein